MVGPLQLIPSGQDGAARILRRGVLCQIVGILVLSVALITRMPIVLVIAIPLGGLLVVLGFMAWLWAVVWADSG
jgi:hypothetical protein